MNLEETLPHKIIRPIGILNARKGQSILVVFSEISFKAIFVKPNRLNKNFLLSNSPESHWRERELNIYLEACRIKDDCFNLGLIHSGFIDWYTKFKSNILKGFTDTNERHVLSEFNHLYKTSYISKDTPNSKALIKDDCLYYPKKLIDYHACKRISESVRIEDNYVIVPLMLIRSLEDLLYFD